MNGRFSDAAYAAARFVGICHANIEGNLSLGVWSNNFSLADVRTQDRMEEESPGNAGMVVVDTINSEILKGASGRVNRYTTSRASKGF